VWAYQPRKGKKVLITMRKTGQLSTEGGKERSRVSGFKEGIGPPGGKKSSAREKGVRRGPRGGSNAPIYLRKRDFSV